MYENNLYHILLDVFEKDDIIRQYRNNEILDNQSLDFYLPKYNIAIECQGSQHFKPIKYFGGEDKYIKTVKLDKLKQDKCIKNKITLLYFAFEKYEVPNDYFSKVYVDVIEFKNKLKEKI